MSVTRRGNCMPSSILKQCVVYQRKHFHNLYLLDERSSLHNKMPELKFKVNLRFIFMRWYRCFLCNLAVSDSEFRCRIYERYHVTLIIYSLNLLKPTGYVMHHQFNIQQLYVLPTYLLTPWSRVILEKLASLQLVKKFPAFYGTRRFPHTVFMCFVFI